MNSRKPLWIVVPKWEQFQHYSDRSPVWIKTYTELLHDPAYLALPGGTRALLHGIWLLYASSHARVRHSTVALSRQLGLKVTMRQVEALSAAGFIRVSASKPLARRYQRASPEKRRVENKEIPLTPRSGVSGAEHLEEQRRATGTHPRATGTNPRARGTNPRAHRYTGCRLTRGTHGQGYVRDVLGTSKPPADWPHPPPERAEVEAALNGRQAEPLPELPDHLPADLTRDIPD